MRLRAALAAAALLGLGGALAPGYAKDAAAPLAVPASSAADPTLDRFSPQPEEVTAPDSTDLAASSDADSGSGTWEPVGRGVASWYGPGLRGHRTASGETFDPSDYTAAHRTLPFGTKVRVTDADGDSVIVRINDRGPFSRGRLIDLSQAAAHKLGIDRAGSGRVTLAVLDDGSDD